MKTWFLVPCLSLFALAHSADISENNWQVGKSTPILSYTAEMFFKKGDLPIGTVVRSGLFTPRYYYDLYDTEGALEVRGITRAFSLGFLFAWGMQIDLYAEDHLIGMIQGELFTSSRAKFAIYGANGQPVAHAFLNDESCNFLIVSANSAKPIAEFEGRAYGEASIWEMKMLQKDVEEIDERVLKIFAGFVTDYQKHFIRPPKKEIHYHYKQK